MCLSATLNNSNRCGGPRVSLARPPREAWVWFKGSVSGQLLLEKHARRKVTLRLLSIPHAGCSLKLLLQICYYCCYCHYSVSSLIYIYRTCLTPLASVGSPRARLFG
ncbi:hypothetical protein BDW71DRAFT_56564 [Aspergillus fruticulosus]